MQDFLWVAAVIGLFAATLAYFRLCDKAWGYSHDNRSLARRADRHRPARLPRRRAHPPRAVL